MVEKNPNDQFWDKRLFLCVFQLYSVTFLYKTKMNISAKGN